MSFQTREVRYFSQQKINCKELLISPLHIGKDEDRWSQGGLREWRGVGLKWGRGTYVLGRLDHWAALSPPRPSLSPA